MKPILGTFTDPPGHARVDLPRLLETKLLLQAGSGFGKSWALRRILEQTHDGCQQFVIDPEGEFATLRERHGYVLAAVNGGDVVAHPRTAGLLARRLVEMKVSAVLDISELKKPERRRFVRLFLEELMGLPRAMWTPLMVAIDEAHEFAPEKDESESLSAVIDLATRGRKRGFSMLAATQRIGKFSKDAAAELHNKLIGFTSLDIDVKRAAFELGMTPTEALKELRGLEPGDFFAIGPAITPTIRRMRIGDVETTHPRPGTRKLQAPPKPTAEIIAVLPKLADLPKEAEQEQKTLEDLRRELAGVRRELTLAKKVNPPPPASASQLDLQAAEARGLARGFALAAKEVKAIMPGLRQDIIGSIKSRSADMIGDAEGALAGLAAALTKSAAAAPAIVERRLPAPSTPSSTSTRRLPLPASRGNGSDTDLSSAARKILAVLSQFPDGCVAGKLTLLTGYRYSGSFQNALSALRTAGYVEGPNTGVMRITAAGEGQGPFPELPVGRDLRDYWLSHPSFGTAARKILAALFERQAGATADELCEATGYNYSGSFQNALSELRTAGVLVGKNTEVMRASDELTP